MTRRLGDGSVWSRSSIVLLGGVLGIVLALNALIFYHNTWVLVDNEQWVSHTQSVLSALDTAGGNIAGAQNSLRSYLFSGDADDLRRCRRAVATVAETLARISRLTSDNAVQQRRVQALRRALPATIPGNLLPDGLPIEYANLGQMRGPAMEMTTRLERAQVIVTTMKGTEVALLDRRSDAAKQATVVSYGGLAVATVADLVLLAGLLLVVLRTLRRRAEWTYAQTVLLQREQAARGEAEAAVAMRDAFLSLASHELKTPLTALLGNAQLLQRRFTARGGLTTDDVPRLEALTRAARGLATLVDQLLDVSRLQHGQLELERAPVDLVAVARHAVETVQHSAPDHHVVLRALDSPVMVMGDEVRLDQVFSNLLTNAIKFSQGDDGVTVEVTCADGMARVAVADHGIGIPEEARARLFERFYRAPNAGLTTTPGLGIGLYVVNEIVTWHGGAIQVSSVVGKGSTFTIELPLVAGGGARPGAAPTVASGNTLS